MADNKDFINILREIRGSGVPGTTYTDGIWYELTIADTDGNPGIYGDILAKYGIIINNLDEIHAIANNLALLNAVIDSMPAITDVTSAPLRTAILALIDIREELLEVASISDNVVELVELYNEGKLPLIDDVNPSADKVYSSLHTQNLHNAQAEALGNLASASGSLVMTGSATPLSTSFSNLVFAVSTQSSNTLVFEILPSEFLLKSNGDYNFFSVVTIALGTNQSVTVEFEVYNTSDNSVLAESLGTINASNGDIVMFPINTLMSIESIPYGGSITAKVRARVIFGSGISVMDFSSMMILSGVSSSGGQLLGRSPMKAVAYLARQTNENLVTVDGSNNFSIEELEILDGGSLTVSDGCVYKVL